jgi:hypothetical protein
MNTARTEITPSQTVEGQDVGELIEGRFPKQLPQGTDQAAETVRQTAENAGRIDVRDFSQLLSGLAVPVAEPFDDQADDHQDQADDQADDQGAEVPAVAAPAGPGLPAETFRLALRLARAGRAWSAERWTAEAARRREVRAERLPELRDARAAYRSARRQDPTRATSSYHRARREMRRAKRRVPTTLPVLATEYGLGMAGIGYFALPLVPGEIWAWSGLGLAVSAVLGLGSLAWWIRRHPRPVSLVPTEEERQLLARLAPEYWTAHAEERGLDGTVTGRPQLGTAGIEAAIRLDGKWTLSKLLSAEENVRALLGARTGLRIQFTHGSHGGWATLALRTRSAADDDDLLWSETNTTFGIDTITGEVVDVPLGQRLLIAGMSGAGKSVASRPLLYKASEGETNVLVIIDLKKVEGRLWDHRARVASTAEEVVEVVEELVAEMTYRLDILPKGKAKWTPSRAHPSITVVVDEGAEAIEQASAVPVVVGHTDKGKPIVEKHNAVAGLGSIARMGRAGEIHLWWMTQKPTMSGPDMGIPPQIASQMGTRICLCVSTASEARTVLGEDAQAKGWNAEDLPAPGVAFVRDGKRKPHQIAVRFMDDHQVIALPDRPIWALPEAVRNAAPAPAAATATATEGLALVQAADDDQAEDQADQGPAATPAETLVLAALANGPRRQKELEEPTGLAKSTLSRTVNSLIAAGSLVRQDDGTLTLTQPTDQAHGA